MALTATFVDADTLTVAGDFTFNFVAGRKTRSNCGVDGYRYGVVSAAAFGGGNTTVDLTAASDALTLNLTEVEWSVDKPGATGNLALHDHDDEDTGDDLLEPTTINLVDVMTISPRVGDPAPGAGDAAIYCKAGEIWMVDDAGNTTEVSPHDSVTGEWIFYSKNTLTRRVVRVDMERMMMAIDNMLGGGYVHEYQE